jgi:hypothetical protein
MDLTTYRGKMRQVMNGLVAIFNASSAEAMINGKDIFNMIHVRMYLTADPLAALEPLLDRITSR